MELEDLGIQLETKIGYSVRDSNLTKLVFDADHVVMTQDNLRFGIFNLRLILYNLTILQNLSANNCIKLTFPLYSLVGNFVQNDRGFIKGIIRPAFFHHNSCSTLVSCLPPEFHFYIEGNKDAYVGRSLGCSKNALYAGIAPSEKLDLDHINSKFAVDLPDKYSRAVFKKFLYS